MESYVDRHAYKRIQLPDNDYQLPSSSGPAGFDEVFFNDFRDILVEIV